MTPSLPPADAWQPLPPGSWNSEAAKHLLRRAGWTARPAEVEQAVSAGLPATLDRLFPAEPVLLPKPRQVIRLEDETPAISNACAPPPSTRSACSSAAPASARRWHYRT